MKVVTLGTWFNEKGELKSDDLILVKQENITLLLTPEEVDRAVNRYMRCCWEHNVHEQAQSAIGEIDKKKELVSMSEEETSEETQSEEKKDDEKAEEKEGESAEEKADNEAEETKADEEAGEEADKPEESSDEGSKDESSDEEKKD